MTKNKILYILIIAGLLDFSCAPSKLISNTPNGIDIKPLYELKFDDNLNVMSLLKDTSISKIVEYKYYDYSKNSLAILGLISTGNMMHSTIELYQGNSILDSENKYQSYKSLFSNSSSDKLYNETGDNLNKYFIIYQRSHMDYNHGLPNGYVNYPDITIGFKKNNYFICIKYNSYSDKTPDYVALINKDIIDLTKIFKTLMNKK